MEILIRTIYKANHNGVHDIPMFVLSFQETVNGERYGFSNIYRIMTHEILEEFQNDAEKRYLDWLKIRNGGHGDE